MTLDLSNRADIARSISMIERLTLEGRALLKKSHGVEPIIIGWTGSPGAGKSTLISAVLAQRLSEYPDRRFAVLAIDPSSTYTGGAVLGDRIRMDAHTLETRIFIRSLASRGMAGGLAPAAIRIARFLAASGFEEIHIETVGAGQNDVEIAEIADTAIVVTAPHAGDAIQGLKAGILEIADLLVVNKSDLDGAAAAAGALEVALDGDSAGWKTPLICSSARTGAGITDVSAAISAHGDHLDAMAGRQEIRRRRRRAEFDELIRLMVMERLRGKPDYAALIAEVEEGRLDPLIAAERAL